jgi:ABC-type proline/glycine betaine transport system permease subunit
MIVKWLEWIIEIGIWLTLISAFIGGWGYGSGFFGSLFSAIFATVLAGVFCALLFGAFIVLMDIRTMVQRIDRRESDST